LADFNKVIKLDPNLSCGYQGRGIAYLNNDNPAAAIADFNRTLQLDPSMVSAYLNRGLALLLQSKDTEAQQDFTRTLELKPTLKSELEARVNLAKELRARKP
jgi:lipoprotein NlpI